MTPTLLAELDDAKAANRPVVLATRLPDGAQQLVPSPSADPALNAAAKQALTDDRSQKVLVNQEPWFLHVHNPPIRAVIVGAVHIAQALAPFAAQLDYAVTIVDPRRSFATNERFPKVTVSTEWPEEALDRLRPDARTAIVTLTHDPKLDDPALDRALRSPAFYIGALGSRKTHAARLARLRALGHADATLARVRGPVGLSIEAVTAPEIALSIAAEMVAVRRGAALGQKRAA